MSLELGIETGLWIAYFVGFISAFGLVFAIQWGTERDNKRMDKIIGARFEKLQSSLNLVKRDSEKPIERNYNINVPTPPNFVRKMPPTLPDYDVRTEINHLRSQVAKCQSDSQEARVAVKNIKPASLYIEPTKTQKEIREIWDQLGEIAKNDCDTGEVIHNLKNGIDEVAKKTDKIMNSLNEVWSVVKELKLAEHNRKNKRH